MDTKGNPLTQNEFDDLLKTVAQKMKNGEIAVSKIIFPTSSNNTLTIPAWFKALCRDRNIEVEYSTVNDQASRNAVDSTENTQSDINICAPYVEKKPTIQENIIYAICQIASDVDSNDNRFARKDVRDVLGIDADNWNASYNPVFQGMTDSPGLAPVPRPEYQQIIRRIERGRYELTEKGEALIQSRLSGVACADTNLHQTNGFINVAENKEDSNDGCPAAMVNTRVDFRIELGPTYYKKGYINPGVEASKRLGKHGEQIKVYLEDTKHCVNSYIDRNDNPNRSVRIVRNIKAIADWYQENYQPGDVVDATIISPNEILLHA